MDMRHEASVRDQVNTWPLRPSGPCRHSPGAAGDGAIQGSHSTRLRIGKPWSWAAKTSDPVALGASHVSFPPDGLCHTHEFSPVRSFLWTPAPC